VAGGRLPVAKTDPATGYWLPATTKEDKHGTELAGEAIKASDKTDNLRADITGEMKDGEIAVSKLALTK
jgi:hypothetical protein